VPASRNSVRSRRICSRSVRHLFNKKDFVAAGKFWPSNYIQLSAHMPPGRDGLFGPVKSVLSKKIYKNALITAVTQVARALGAKHALSSTTKHAKAA
jgi:hypothetical protein